jgi:alkylhydroperoxidase/carboxymuconolactone decarboxylase family protein
MRVLLRSRKNGVCAPLNTVEQTGALALQSDQIVSSVRCRPQHDIGSTGLQFDDRFVNILRWKIRTVRADANDRVTADLFRSRDGIRQAFSEIASTLFDPKNLISLARQLFQLIPAAQGSKCYDDLNPRLLTVVERVDEKSGRERFGFLVCQKPTKPRFCTSEARSLRHYYYCGPKIGHELLQNLITWESNFRMHYYNEDDLGRFGDVGSNRPDLFEKFMAWYEACQEDGALSRREKALIGLAVSHAVQCPYCIDAYSQSCLESGSNLEQMTEAIHMASAIRGGASLIHGLQARNSVNKVSM